MTRIFLIMSAAAVSAGFLCSCSSESPAYNRENIKATWIVDTYDGVLQDERDYTVMTFSASGTVVYAGVLSMNGSNFQWGENTLRYETYCCDLSISGTYEGLFGHVSSVETFQDYSYVHSEDSLMTLGLEQYMLAGQDITSTQYSTMTMRKIPLTYAQADTILGVWQFNTMNGTSFSDCRVQFGEDGVLTVFRRTGENSWSPMGSTAADSADYYNLYSDFVALTMYDNDILGTAGKWDVKCFSIDSLSGVDGRMFLESSGDVYGLSYISSN